MKEETAVLGFIGRRERLRMRGGGGTLMVVSVVLLPMPGRMVKGRVSAVRPSQSRKKSSEARLLQVAVTTIEEHASVNFIPVTSAAPFTTENCLGRLISTVPGASF